MRRRRLAPVFALGLFAPFVAEFLLGDQWLGADHGPGSQLAMFLALAPWYGAGAVLIRELARRTGRGWPTILLLALAFGLVEEGLLTQSLFNPHYLGLDLLSYGQVDALGIGLPWTVFVLTLHVVWSISTPIAVVEGVWPGRDPWLGRIGLGVASAVLVLGALVIFGGSWLNGGFVAAPGQLLAAGLLAVIIVVVALRLPRVTEPGRPGRVLPAAITATVLASAFQLVQHYGPRLFPAWLTVTLLVIMLAGTIMVVIRRRSDVLGLALGPVLTYVWVGLSNAAPHGLPALIEQAVIAAVAVAVVASALRRHRLEPVTRNATGADAVAIAASPPAPGARGGR